MPLEDKTNEFIASCVDKVMDKVSPYFIQKLLLDPFPEIEGLQLGEQEKKDLLQKVVPSSYRKTVHHYVVRMLRTMLRAREPISATKLSTLWKGYSTPQFAEKEAGLNEEDGKLVFTATRDTLLSELETAVTVTKDRQSYTIQHIRGVLYITPQQKK